MRRQHQIVEDSEVREDSAIVRFGADGSQQLGDAVGEYAHLGRSIHAVVAADDAAREAQRLRVKIGRNEPCPCGSGRKYKKCCGVTTR